MRRALARQDPRAAHFVRGAYLQDWLLLDTDWSWRAARDGREYPSSLANFAECHTVVQLVDAIVESHERGAWVAVGRPVEVAA